MSTVDDRYVASMVLSGVGDALGFKNGGWEFCHSGELIHKELKELGGLNSITVALPNWKVSDDTVMHLAVAEALVNKSNADKEAFYQEVAAKYKECMKDMSGRSPGFASRGNTYALQLNTPGGLHIPFDERGGGCGAAMRSMCIGLRYPGEQNLDDLIAVSVETGRMTHHHPTGYLGALASALFTSYAIEGKPVTEWGHHLMNVLPRALNYVESQNRYVAENKEAWPYFKTKWEAYLKLRGIEDGKSEPKFPEKYDIKDRDSFYKSLSFSGWGGASGHDAPMIAYDALLAAGDNWEKLCSHGMFHSGDSDSTGVIAAACYGAMYGFNGVPEKNHKRLEYRSRLAKLGEQLYTLSHPDKQELANQDKSENIQAAADTPSVAAYTLEDITEAEESSNEHAQKQEAEKPPSSLKLKIHNI